VKRLNAIEARLAELDWSNALVFVIEGWKAAGGEVIAK
jgi:hypothetical protein